MIPMRYQDPILLAEAAGTADLHVGGRLDLALATGTTAAWDTRVWPPRARTAPSPRSSGRTSRRGMAIRPVFHGTPDEVAEAVLADPGLAAADRIVPAMGGSAHSSSRRRGRTPRGSVLTDRVL